MGRDLSRRDFSQAGAHLIVFNGRVAAQNGRWPITCLPKSRRKSWKTSAAERRCPPSAGDDYYRLNGAGEMLVYSAADFEDFVQPRREIPPTRGSALKVGVRLLAEHRWPFRLHATGSPWKVVMLYSPHGGDM
jgi:predicted amidohydrolase YtcJ